MSQKQKDAVIKYIQEVGQLLKGKQTALAGWIFPHYVSIAEAPEERVTVDRRILGPVHKKNLDLKNQW